MFKKIYEKLFAKALQTERDAHAAELRAVKEENIELNGLLVAGTKKQIALMNEINELKNQLAVSESKTHVAALTNENARLKEQYYAGEEALRKMDAELLDAKWQLALAHEKIEALKTSTSDESLDRFAASKAIAFFTVLAQKSTEDLRKSPSNFTVKAEEGKWLVVTGSCCNCGCDLTKEFCDERTALLYALLRTSYSQKPNEALCSVCGN